MTARPSPRARGFTLLEVIVVVAMVAIVAAVALPSYRESVAKSARANAASELLSAQQWMERFYSENYRYDRNRAGTSIEDASQFQANFSTSPRPGDGGPRYRIVLAPQPQSYTITAQRIAGGPMANDPCGDLVIGHTGQRTVNNRDTSRYPTMNDAVAACWRQ